MKLNKENLRACFDNAFKFEFSVMGEEVFKGIPTFIVYEDLETKKRSYSMGLVGNIEDLEHDTFEIIGLRIVGIANFNCSKIWQFEPENESQFEIVSIEIEK